MFRYNYLSNYLSIALIHFIAMEQSLVFIFYGLIDTDINYNKTESLLKAFFVWISF